MDDQILSVLEKRVSDMEHTVFGDKPTWDPKEATIAEGLLNAHTMIKSALSCRDNVVKVLQRLPELNDFLDPTYPNSNIETEAKRQYILLLYPELKALANQLKEYQRVEKYADSDAIANVPNLRDRLDAVVVDNVNTHIESGTVSKQVLETVNKYNEILGSLEVLMMQFDQTAAQIEEEQKPKRPSTDD